MKILLGLLVIACAIALYFAVCVTITVARFSRSA